MIENLLSLYDVDENREVRVVDIFSGREAKRRLMSIGIKYSDILIKLNSPSWGALLVKNMSTGSTKIALGRNLAKKIMVEYVA